MSGEVEVEGAISSRYSTGQDCSALYGQGAIVPWDHIVWLAGGIQKLKM